MTAAAATVISTVAPRRRLVLRIGVATLLLALLVLVGAAVALVHVLDAAPVQVTINGQTLPSPLDLASLSVGEHVALVLAALAVLLALLVVVPLVLLVVAAAVALAILLGFGLPMLVIAGLATALLAPLALLAWLLWRALRPSPTMPS